MPDLGRHTKYKFAENQEMKKAPWHSAIRYVHHNDTDCNTGNNIETENLRKGTGGKPLCQECRSLS